MDDLLTHVRDRCLVSIRRGDVDDNSIQAYLLQASSELVLLQYVYDFNLDGLMLLRVADISEVSRTATDRFQDDLLRSEGLKARVPFHLMVDLSGWRAAISDLARAHRLLILECEHLADPKFVIGRVLNMGAEAVSMESFTGTARWNERPEVLSYEDITACQVGTNYCNVYERYFKRAAP